MFSIIMPLDTNRLEQFKKTKRVYDAFPQVKEFIIPTRNYRAVRDYLKTFDLMRGVKIIPYKHDVGFNPSMALNLGVKKAKYNTIIITSPEVKPLTAVLDQLREHPGQNIVCQVFDEDEEGNHEFSLVNNHYRNINPAYYFLAMYNKADIESINGWDEDFMDGYAYEDDDFGARWNRAGLPFSIREDIQALHQYHPRSETIPGGTQTNIEHLNSNNTKGVTKCANGLVKLDVE